MTIDTGTEHGQPSNAKAEIAVDNNEMKQRRESDMECDDHRSSSESD